MPKRLSLLFDYFAKSRVCLAFPKAIQDPSIKFRRTVPEFGFAEFFSFCTRLLVKQEFPAAKALVGMTGFGPQSSVHRKKLCAQEKALCLCTALEKALCTGKSSVHWKKLCACARHRKKLCARQKALCTGKSSVHRKKLCARHWKKLCARHWKKLRARNQSGKRGKDFPKTKKNFKPSHSFRFRAG